MTLQARAITTLHKGILPCCSLRLSGNSIFNGVLIIMFALGLIGHMLKKVDKGGAIKKVTGKAMLRGGLNLFDIVKKW